MDYRLMFPKEFVGAPDLHGKDVTLTISSVGTEELRVEDGSMEMKPVISFAEMERREKKDAKRMVLNVTNAKVIAKIYGNEMDAWIGQRITLYPTTCLAFGEKVDCIRVRKAKPAPPKGATT